MWSELESFVTLHKFGKICFSLISLFFHEPNMFRMNALQKELALKPAKNATTPNPSKIIPLQSRKENSWETEETLARAAVTGQMAQPLMFMMMMMMMMRMYYRNI
jgi:hypothetical protein